MKKKILKVREILKVPKDLRIWQHLENIRIENKADVYYDDDKDFIKKLKL